MERLVPIGQCAASIRLLANALRLYAEQGLLPPAWVDPDSGCRYYRLYQVGRVRLIRLLRAADMPLAKIGPFFQEPTVGRLNGYTPAGPRRGAGRPSWHDDPGEARGVRVRDGGHRCPALARPPPPTGTPRAGRVGGLW